MLLIIRFFIIVLFFFFRIILLQLWFGHSWPLSDGLSNSMAIIFVIIFLLIVIVLSFVLGNLSLLEEYGQMTFVEAKSLEVGAAQELSHY